MPRRTKITKSFWSGGKRVTTFFTRRRVPPDTRAFVHNLFRRIDRQFNAGAMSKDAKNDHYCNWCTIGEPNIEKLKNGKELEHWECDEWTAFKRKIMRELE